MSNKASKDNIDGLKDTLDEYKTKLSNASIESLNLWFRYQKADPSHIPTFIEIREIYAMNVAIALLDQNLHQKNQRIWQEFQRLHEAIIRLCPANLERKYAIEHLLRLQESFDSTSVYHVLNDLRFQVVSAAIASLVIEKSF